MEKAYNDFIEECKYSTHGYWKSGDFTAWGKKSLNLIDEVCGVTNKYYTIFLRMHHEALVLGTGDSRFGTHVSLCISILKSVHKESIISSNVTSS
ncbi:MAG: hypothetical protein O7C70_08195 [Candidatus Dadabacteria bacterium]|nr:hypothetical protein [Candidatus Dadabacteria bacterium]